MLKTIWAAIIVVFVVFVFAVLRWGINPRALVLIAPSEFDQPAKIGETAFLRLMQEVGEQQVVIIGGIPNNPTSNEIALGFFAQAKKDQRPFSTVMTQTEMPLALDGAQHIDFNGDSEQIAATIRNLHAGERLFIYTVNIFATHLLHDNPIQRLEHILNRKLMTVTIMGLALKATEISQLDPPCRGLERDQQGTAPLGCVALTRSKGLFRKHLTDKRFVMLLDQQGATDYLMLVHAPRP